MTVDPAKAVSVEYEGTKTYFCCPGCATKFRADPARYLKMKQVAGSWREPACRHRSGDESNRQASTANQDQESSWDCPGNKRPYSLRRREENHSLAMVDLSTLKVLSTYQVGEDPDVLAYDSGLKRLYVSAESGTVTIFRRTTGNWFTQLVPRCPTPTELPSIQRLSSTSPWKTSTAIRY